MVRDWLDLFRAGNCVTGFVGVFLGAILTLEDFPTGDNLKITALLALSVYSFMASWNALNDYLDIEIDKINRPDRPCLLYTSPSPRDKRQSRMPSSA